MASYNKAIIMGNLGKDPKVAEDGSWTHASVETSNSWKDKKTDEWQEKTTWHRVMAYGYAAEALAKAKKGDTVLIEGSLDAFPPKEEGGEERPYLRASMVANLFRRVAPQVAANNKSHTSKVVKLKTNKKPIAVEQ